MPYYIITPEFLYRISLPLKNLCFTRDFFLTVFCSAFKGGHWFVIVVLYLIFVRKTEYKRFCEGLAGDKDQIGPLCENVMNECIFRCCSNVLFIFVID